VVERLNELATGGLDPDVTVIFDMDPQTGLGRALDRNSTVKSRENRLDEEPLDFHEHVRAGYMRLASQYPERVRVIDASGNPGEVFQRILEVLPGELL